MLYWLLPRRMRFHHRPLVGLVLGRFVSQQQNSMSTQWSNPQLKGLVTLKGARGESRQNPGQLTRVTMEQVLCGCPAGAHLVPTWCPPGAHWVPQLGAHWCPPGAHLVPTGAHWCPTGAHLVPTWCPLVPTGPIPSNKHLKNTSSPGPRMETALV